LSAEIERASERRRRRRRSKTDLVTKRKKARRRAAQQKKWGESTPARRRSRLPYKNRITHKLAVEVGGAELVVDDCCLQIGGTSRPMNLKLRNTKRFCDKLSIGNPGLHGHDGGGCVLTLKMSM
jgi:hypothetical protein